jgi:beta-ribofuranosylaminobenzene 5'-phosphate synthase
MIRIRAFSRLHFGLFRLPATAAEVVPQRTYGGVGLMIEEPGVVLAARPAPAWSAAGRHAERVLAFAERFAQALAGDIAVRPHHFAVARAGPEHMGLGTGTQLGLAVAKLLAEAHGFGQWSAAELARRVGRGLRSALGVHGFERGGFLVEAGKSDLQAISPLVARVDFPESWRIVLMLPQRQTGLHGQSEVQAFQHLGALGPQQTRTDVLCRLTLLGMLPALVESDLSSFGEALYEFNRLVGESFQPVQGGIYSHSDSEEVVSFLRQQGIRGTGQSSWGPALFAVVGDSEQAEDLARRLRQRFALEPEEVLVTRAANRGAHLSI